MVFLTSDQSILSRKYKLSCSVLWSSGLIQSFLKKLVSIATYRFSHFVICSYQQSQPLSISQRVQEM